MIEKREWTKKSQARNWISFFFVKSKAIESNKIDGTNDSNDTTKKQILENLLFNLDHPIRSIVLRVQKNMLTKSSSDESKLDRNLTNIDAELICRKQWNPEHLSDWWTFQDVSTYIYVKTDKEIIIGLVFYIGNVRWSIIQN